MTETKKPERQTKKVEQKTVASPILHEKYVVAGFVMGALLGKGTASNIAFEQTMYWVDKLHDAIYQK